MFRSEDKLDAQELQYLYEKCHIWVQENFKQGDIIIAFIGVNDANETELIHCFIYNRFEDLYKDVRGCTPDFDKFIHNFDISGASQFSFVELEEFQRFLTELEETGDIDPDNY